jgi:hypothetical protein
VVAIAPQRLVTAGVIHVNAVSCTAIALLGAPALSLVPSCRIELRADIRRTILIGFAALAATSRLDWAVVRAVYGDRFAGQAGHHIRFGPRATTR